MRRAYRAYGEKEKRNERDGYFVRGQRNTDYNWSLLAEFDNMDSAKEYIKSIRTDPVQQLVYGPDGYGIRI